MKSSCNEDAKIKAGKTGQFDVITDGKVIFSKEAAGRFPLEGEVEQALAKLRKG